jgi:hypothetical protein
MAWGSAPIVSHAQGLGTGGGTSSSVNSTGSDTIFLSVGVSNTAALSVSDSKSNTWTLVRDHDNGSGLKTYLYRTATPATVGTGHTFTATNAGGKIAVALTAFTGGATSSIDDQENSNGSIFQQTIQPGSITPSEAGTLIITGVMSSDNNREPSVINSGFTVAASYDDPGTSVNVGIAYLVQGSAAAVNPTWTFENGTATHQAAAIASFKAAAGAAQDTPEVRGRPFGLHGQVQMHQLLSQ